MTYLQKRLGELIQPPIYRVSSKGQPLLHLEDLDFDGVTEVLVPCVESDTEVDSDSFSDFSNLYKRGKSAYPFFLYIYRVGREGLAFSEKISFGPRSVYGGIARIQIVRASPFPFVIVVKFQTLEGEEQEWLVFSGRSVSPGSRLAFREAFASKLLVEDVNGDRIIDVIVQEKAAEEGGGFETFLTWFRWNGRRFEEHASTNILHNLKGFLGRVSEILMAGEWQEFLELAFLEEDLKRYGRRNDAPEQVIYDLFGLQAFFEAQDSDAVEVLKGLKEVVFPAFLENPFIARDERGSYFPLTFRCVGVDGVSFVSEIPLYMMKNPFGERQFFLEIE